MRAQGRVGHPRGKNPGDVWTLPTSGYRGAHRATMPVELARRAIAAACPELRCTACRRPWQRERVREVGHAALRPTCRCEADIEPGIVLDPFMGSGTTAVAAEQLGRDWLGIELNPGYAAEAMERIEVERDANREREEEL
jgi:DNA modification methylase